MENKIKKQEEKIECGPWYIIRWENRVPIVIEKYEYCEEADKRVEELNDRCCGYYEKLNRNEIKKQFGIWLCV